MNWKYAVGGAALVAVASAVAGGLIYSGCSKSSRSSDVCTEGRVDLGSKQADKRLTNSELTLEYFICREDVKNRVCENNGGRCYNSIEEYQKTVGGRTQQAVNEGITELRDQPLNLYARPASTCEPSCVPSAPKAEEEKKKPSKPKATGTPAGTSEPCVKKPDKLLPPAADY